MAAFEPGQQPSLTALPRLEDLPKSGDGYDPDKVREAFEAFRRHSSQLQAQLRVLQAASRSGQSVQAVESHPLGVNLRRLAGPDQREG